MYRSILVPLDGSAYAESSLPLALEISRRTGADVHLATVLEAVTSFAYEGWEDAAVEWSREYLDNVIERIEPEAGGSVSRAILHGDVTEKLHAEAVDRAVDLVVMASHGRGPLSRLWLGSVADGFVRRTHLPVLVVRPDEAQRPADFGHSIGKILVPLDGSVLSESALEHATELGALFDATYHITRVVSYPIDIASPYLPHTAQINEQVVRGAQKAATDYLAVRAEELRARGLQVETSVVVDAQPGKAVIEQLEATGADMVAMATHGRKGLQRLMLGSTADKVLRGVHVPLLLHRPFDTDED